MEEQVIISVPLSLVSGQAKKGLFSASLRHLADMFTSEILATIKLSHFVRLKSIPLPYLVSFNIIALQLYVGLLRNQWVEVRSQPK